MWTPEQPGLTELFVVFARMLLAGFGGVLVWVRRALADQRRTAEEFSEAFALCHFLPDLNIVNLPVAFGRFRGVPASITAFLGLMCASSLILALTPDRT